MKVLLAVDLTSGAEELVDRATRMATRLGATIDVAYADAFEALMGGAQAAKLDPVLAREWRRIIDEDRKDLERLAARIPEPHRGFVQLLDGAPAEAVTKRAASGYDMLFVGTHGRTGLAHMWLGSVAEKIVRSSPIPVLVLRAHDLGVRPSILAALDPHEPADAILEVVRPIAEKLGATVDLVAVHPDPVIAAASRDPGLMQLVVEERDRVSVESRDALHTLLASLPEPMRGGVKAEIGFAADRIAAMAAGHDLVVLGTHGRKGVNHLLLGSVAERVVRSVTCPVLLLPLHKP